MGCFPIGCYRQLPKDGRYLYLDRYDHDWDYFDHQLRPARTPEAQHSWECGEPQHTPGIPNLQMKGIPSQTIGWVSGICSRGMLENSKRRSTDFSGVCQAVGSISTAQIGSIAYIP